MKLSDLLVRASVVGASGLFFTGCLFKPTTVATRSFVLSPLPAVGGAAPANDALAIGVGLVKVPAYLLGTSMAVRKGPHEIERMEASLWAERLDISFQRTLAANLSVLLPTDQIRLSTWNSADVRWGVFVNLEQLDVDSQGLGTLVAWWRITTPSGDRTLRGGETRLSRTGPPPYLNPEGVATTLSGLTAEFSEVLARVIRETASANPVRP